MSTIPYTFNRNNPYDRNASIELVIPRLYESQKYMQAIRSLEVPRDAIAIWYLGQNGFILKDFSGQLLGIDLYLSNSCATTFQHLPMRLDRQLPVFIEPEDLEIDVFITTHSHDDHADPETIRRVRKDGRTRFVGPFDSMRIYRECGVPDAYSRLIHPGESLELSASNMMQATFALPTDTTDLNHSGVLLSFDNGITFYNTGDTAYAERLGALIPQQVDVCAICINGGFHNLGPDESAQIVKAIHPRVVIPCHYDMMINNVGSPESFRKALNAVGSDVPCHQMNYYEPWLYRRSITSTITN